MLMRGVSVKETAFNLGYKDQFFFSKQFHQKLGYPPSAINPLNPRGVRRYQAKDDATAEPSTEKAASPVRNTVSTKGRKSGPGSK
jgi:AraC-like DNA-binding protein